MQKIIFTGNLAKDVETKETQNGNKIAKFTVAVSRPYKKEVADFFNVIAYNKLGELCSTYLSKGRKVAVSGYIATHTYEKDGDTRKIYEVIAEEVEFLSPNTNQDEDKPF